MDDTIIALLNNNLRVIIPDFGAFIIRQKQPRIIVFNEFLRYNDGILIDFIVKTEGIDREIAEQRVLDFAEDGTKLLASGRELVIEGLGSLRKDSSGKINFIEAPLITEADKPSSKAAEIFVEEEKNQDIPTVIEKAIPKKPKAKTTAVKKSKTARTTAKPAAIKKAIAPVAIEEAVAPVALEEATAPVAVEATSVQIAIEEAPEPVAVEEAIAPVAIEEPPSKPVPVIEVSVESHSGSRVSVVPGAAATRAVPVSTNRILAWALLILIVNAGILSWFVIRKRAQNKQAGKSESAMISDTLYDQLGDSVRAAALDSSIIFNDVPDNSGNPKEDLQNPGSRYYIVAGCFRDEVNADALVTSLKHLGYNAEKFGKIGNLFAVCFASFDNKDEAVPELKKIREKVPSAWMTKF